MKKAISYLFIFLGIQLLASGIVTLALSLTGHNELVASPYTQIASMILFCTVTALVFIRLHWAQPSVSYLKTRPRMAIFWSIIAAIGCIIPSMAFQEYLPQLPNLVEAELGELMNAKGGYFVACLLVPLVEELVFRGAILRALLNWRPANKWGMIAVSALLFALAHMNPAQMPHAFLIGLLLGWMYCRTHSIVPTVAFHWANNTMAYIMFKLYPDPDTSLADIFGSNLHVLFAVGFSLLILLPALYQLSVWLREPEQA